jgi:hypothetical protein
MKIAILEICSHTHYSVINGLIKTYSTDPHNSIVLYTNESIAKAIRENGFNQNTSLVVMDADAKLNEDYVSQFLSKIEKNNYDRLHICTLEAHYKAFSQFTPSVKEVFLHVHDIDIWFDSNVKNNLKNFVFHLKNKANIVRETAKLVREIVVRNPKRQQILDNIQKYKHHYVVHSTGQKSYLRQFVGDTSIIIFPFAINEGLEKPQSPSPQKGKIRICIPGIVTDSRRDYSGLFKILETIMPKIKDKLIFDFLGFVEKREPQLLEKIRDLEKQGLEVYYYTEFVYGEKFDSAIEKSDILLNNQKVTTSHTTKYGVTKESGMLFSIIRGSKPGILPQAYAVDKEFEDVLLYYTSDESLKDIILGLASGAIQVEKYKAQAIEVARSYTPQNLYGRLVKKSENVQGTFEVPRT